MKTKKEKINWLINNTKNLNKGQQLFWENYLNMRLIFSNFTHKEIDDFVMFCKNTDGGCYLTTILESEIHQQ